MTQIKDYTHNFSMKIPEFNIATWHDAMAYNFTLIDALLGNFFEANKFKGPWLVVTGYSVGDIIYITDETDKFVGKIFKVLKDHVSGNTKFETFFTEHPECYEEYADLNGVLNYFKIAKDYATKLDSKVIENGVEVDYSAKHYANESANSATLAENYKADTLTYKTDAENAKTLAESYATAAQGYKNVAEHHKNESNINKNDAKDSALLAQRAKDDAQLAANSAHSSASFAQQSENNAAQSAVLAQSSKEAIQNSETVVQTARDETKQYADFVKDNLGVFTNDIKTLQDSIENIEKTTPQLIQQEHDRAVARENELADKINTIVAPDLSQFATKDELDQKQQKGDYALKTELPVVPTKVSAFENDAGYLTKHQDISGLATKEELDGKQDKGDYATKDEIPDVSGKQDKIEDLEEIRQGASKGETAVQPNQLSAVATSGSYNDLKDKPTIPEGGGDVDVLSAIEGQTINPKTILASDGQIQIGYGQVQTLVEEDNKNVTSTTSMIFGGNMGIWSDYQFYSKKTGETSYQSIGLNFMGYNDVELSAMTMDDYGYSSVFMRSSEIYMDYSGYDGAARALNISVKTGKITYSDAEKGEIELDVYDLLSAVKNIIDNGGA